LHFAESIKYDNSNKELIFTGSLDIKKPPPKWKKLFMGIGRGFEQGILLKHSFKARIMNIN